ncbi:hypothetical protein L6452_15602 [Arctium lappa]|uniref:Uncharacterized protein n=1 Tax=Arctium lappa TaxID=4217 RepID=A0ACB9CPC4_ARCLA|nr:hypothetical protein L6452_15602 [Arctium lappa]
MQGPTGKTTLFSQVALLPNVACSRFSLQSGIRTLTKPPQNPGFSPSIHLILHQTETEPSISPPDCTFRIFFTFCLCLRALDLCPKSAIIGSPPLLITGLGSSAFCLLNSVKDQVWNLKVWINFESFVDNKSVADLLREYQVSIIMDTKSLAKSKRAHSQHHKKHHPNQKVKGATSSVGATGVDKAPGKVVKEKPRHPQGPAALPSNWDRYEDENDPITEDQKHGQASQPSDIVVPKSKGADYAYLISEAKSQNSTWSSSEIFSSLDDFVSDFGQGKDAFFTVRGESLLSSIQNDSFFVDDKKPASYEASFLSLNLQALSEQLAKIDLPKRLFMEDDLFPPELYSEIEECHKSNQGHDRTKRNELQTNNDHEVTSYDTTKSHHRSVQDPTSSISVNPMVQQSPNSNPESVAKPSVEQSNFKPETAEAELDMLLDSFADTNLMEKASTSKKTTIAIDIDDTLDELLKETSTPAVLDQNGAPSSHEPGSTPVASVSHPSQPVSKFEPGDDFDSWLDTI